MLGTAGTGEEARRSTNADKSSAPHHLVQASDIAAISQTPLPDQTSSHAPPSPRSARATASIPPGLPASLRTRPASGMEDPETRSRQRFPPPPIAARLSRPRL